MTAADITRFLDQLERLDEVIRPGAATGEMLEQRERLIGQIGNVVEHEPEAFEASHLDRLRRSWRRLERCRTEMAVARQLLAAEFNRLRSEQLIYDRISDSLTPAGASWELAG